MKINYTKSEALNLTLPPDKLTRALASCSFQWVSSSITYLGIKITGDLKHTYNANSPPLLNTIQGWMSKPFSWFGRAAVLKMVILPRILYHFHTLPISIPWQFFKRLEVLKRTFIWMGKKTCIKLETLTRSKEGGGIGLPDFKLYHLGIHLGRILDWNCHREQKDWVALEETLSSLHLRFLPLNSMEETTT